MLFSLVCTLIALVWPTTSQLSVNLTAGCTFSLGGHDFDLNPARDTSSDYTSSDSDYTYVMNFCGQAMNADCGQRTGIACQFEGGAIEAALSKDDGSPPLAELLDASTPSKGVQIRYDNGDLCYQTGFMGPRHAILKLTCSADTEKTFTITENPQCTHNIAMNIRAACPLDFTPSGAEGGLSDGSLFLILFLVFTILYFVGGFVFKTKKKGTSGIESIPNIDIWQQIPGLVKDGCKWTHMMIKTKGQASSYEEV